VRTCRYGTIHLSPWARAKACDLNPPFPQKPWKVERRISPLAAHRRPYRGNADSDVCGEIISGHGA
jgi:hypothetical protein